MLCYHGRQASNLPEEKAHIVWASSFHPLGLVIMSTSEFYGLIFHWSFCRIVEGSSDGGSSWYALDRQTSQKFDSRFQRKLYRIESCKTQSNAFRYLWILWILCLPTLPPTCQKSTFKRLLNCEFYRFTFLSVRDVKSTSRLQIGSIDLYAENRQLPMQEEKAWVKGGVDKGQREERPREMLNCVITDLVYDNIYSSLVLADVFGQIWRYICFEFQ